ncbi:PAS domain S-box protein [Magnetospirillum fulvum]|uniref:histidine kinase n=1 Tax=Magnetospirillum fulvum TaxID=1082 RepID=A0A1H6HTV3_MAGFU|nr:PAS domain S-box protein [Magnetospirillum fulvum]SEH37570.1 PAS domain S-box-containing protein [Magnetospirillum fulvum]
MPTPNENLPISNEGLQSLNEELHAVNEELQSVNEELTAKVEELTRLNDDLDNLIAATDIGTIFLDLTGRIRRFTPIAAVSIALAEADIGRSIFDLTLNLDYPTFDDDLRSVLDGGPAIEHEAVSTGDGQVMMVRIRPYRTGRSALAGAVLTFVDVTRLTAAEKRLQVYINSLPHQVAVIDSDGIIRLVNAAWARFAAENGGRPDLIGVGNDYLKACDPRADGGAVSAGVRAVLLGQAETFSWEYPCHSPREFRWFLMNVAPVQGGIGGAVVSHINITDRKRIEEDLRLAASVFENSGEGIVITDAQERIVSVNRAFTETTGYTPEDVIGRTPRMFVSSRHDSAFYRDMWNELSTSGVWRGEVWNRRKGGKAFPVWLTISHVMNSDGTICNHVAVFSDISDRKENERRLLAINAELEQFAYVASHDLREPLRMVTSYLGMIQRRIGTDIDQDTRDYMAFAVDGARRMDNLILDLLEYSRIGRVSRRPKRFSLSRTIERTLSNLKVAIEETNTVIATTGDDLVAETDEDDCLRVLQNLIANAIKYCPPDRTPMISISCRTEGDLIAITVADNGIGIPENQFERIFRMFQRLHGREDYGGGTGIGLAICKKSVERMGGTIQVESVPGVGSSFTFTLPAAAV